MSFLLPLGFNVETVSYKNINFTAWDVGGRSNIVSAMIWDIFRIA